MKYNPILIDKFSQQSQVPVIIHFSATITIEEKQRLKLIFNKNIFTSITFKLTKDQFEKIKDDPGILFIDEIKQLNKT